jgi:Ca2+-binding EF-hand superfamily protein
MSRTIDTQLCAGVSCAFVILAASLTGAQDATLPVVVPVKTLSSGSQSYEAPERDAMMAQPAPPQPTLPGGKLPQYQIGRATRESLMADELDDARVRFLLALPAQLVLVETKLTIDGLPFRMAREQRIEELLERLRQPAPETDVKDVSSDVPDEGDTTGGPAVESRAERPDEDSAGPVEGNVAPDEGVAEAEDEEGEPEPEPVTPPTVASYSLAGSATEYLRRYAAATGQEPSVDEVRWLLDNWSDGPVLLLLQDNFQRFRARERPVFDVLDRDRNGTVAADELELAVQSFNECDLNRDEVVDASEIAEAVNDPRIRAAGASGAGPLLFAIPDEASATSTYQRLAARYAVTTLPRFDDNSDKRFDVSELAALQSGEPDVTLEIAFQSSAASESTIAVTAVNRRAGDEAALPLGVDATITLPLGGATVVFSAVQGSGSDQISLGAVVDGYPILPEIDPNDDGRFTIRELRGLVESLKRLDTDADGRITADEAQPPVRVCFGLGPIVHRELAGIRSVYRGPTEPLVEGPGWFVRMDVNRDRDLTRGEFPGTDEQFAALDADSDELISATEALDFDQKSRGTDDSAAAPETETPTAADSETEQ